MKENSTKIGRRFQDWLAAPKERERAAAIEQARKKKETELVWHGERYRITDLQRRCSFIIANNVTIILVFLTLFHVALDLRWISLILAFSIGTILTKIAYRLLIGDSNKNRIG